jgi:hypothetical protein
MKRLSVITLLLLSFLLMPPLYAQNSYSEFERGLNLTDSQRRRTEGVNQRYIEEWRFQRQETLRKRIELQELKKNPSANMDRIEKAQRELRDIERSREHSYNRYRSDLSQVLDEKQRERYNSFTESERNRRLGPQSPRGTDFRGPRGLPEPQGARVPRVQNPRAPEAKGRDFQGRENRSYQTRERPARNRALRGYER